jgi:hypothetical protein
MKALKAARKSHDVEEQAILRKAIWNKFVRGLRCPYCSAPRDNPEQLQKHMNCCRRKTRRTARDAAPDPDFPTLGKPVKGTLRWKILRSHGIC